MELYVRVGGTDDELHFTRDRVGWREASFYAEDVRRDLAGDILKCFPSNDLDCLVQPAWDVDSYCSVRGRCPCGIEGPPHYGLSLGQYVGLGPACDLYRLARVALEYQALGPVGVVLLHADGDEAADVAHVHALFDELRNMVEGETADFSVVAEAVVVRQVDSAVYVAIHPVLCQVNLDGAVSDLNLHYLVTPLPQKVNRDLDACESVRRVVLREDLAPMEAYVADHSSLNLVLHLAGVAHVDYVPKGVPLEGAYPGGQAGEEKAALYGVVGYVAQLLLKLHYLVGYGLSLARAQSAVSGVDCEFADAVGHVHHLVECGVGVGQPGHGVVLVADVLVVFKKSRLKRQLPRHVYRVVGRTGVLLSRRQLVLIVQQTGEVGVHVREHQALDHYVGYSLHGASLLTCPRCPCR